ncbi:hypothetical protein LCGC14_0575640 [marine sediment metagenome]|uniref:Uncharacterized protein n=1 Tax=marine sediment metagenome TaxID=412755 RepID=A0A0F9U452_9ZZZZ
MSQKTTKDKLDRIFQNGGPHLGTVRSWMQRCFHNGNRVTWGSNDQLDNTDLTPRRMERLAEDIKDAVVRKIAEYLDREQKREQDRNQGADQ